MTKCNKILIKLTLFVSLFIACSLTGKARLESSVKDITDEIKRAIEEAKKEGVNVDSFTEKKTGSRVAGPKIKEAKKRVITLTEKFLKEIEEEANILKESGGSDELSFSAMYDLILKVSTAIEGIGMQDMSGTVSEAAGKTSPNTAEGIIEIAKAINTKLQRIKGKQKPPSTDK
ncbi:decorin-binding protein DbpA (plasmid) [Borreliella yangtzensis]|uniref:decorin-binding protein DbpA n=1 Tax=Borreliella yangtzensis TaxID=683292 RepID=UPI002648D88A|nr:decorin-binding protein DbpA [Borreliella yangtzensis]WKC74805.1 decorin-binding protein DbpA [Borreliella yangtzensis]